MERLQEALSRARQRRAEAEASGVVPQTQSSTPAPQPDAPAKQVSKPVQPRPPVSAKKSVAQAWSELPQFTPNERLLRTNRVVSYFGQKNAAPFDMMRTKIVQQAKANSWKRIAITSPTPRCGKTTIAVNLAFSLSRQADLRTVLVETDMRRPEMERMIGGTGNFSFARALSGQEPVENHLFAYGSNLAFATNHVPASNSAELLQSESAQQALDELDEQFAPDLVLFDTPPMLGSDDTVGFLSRVDAAILVAAAELSTIEEIDAIEAEIAAVTNVFGVVFNKSRYQSKGSNHDYSYY